MVQKKLDKVEALILNTAQKVQRSIIRKNIEDKEDE